MGAIFRCPAAGTPGQPLLSNGPSGTALVFQLPTPVTAGRFSVQIAGVAHQLPAANALVTGRPYFVAFSWTNAAAISYVIVPLDTGGWVSGTMANSTAAPSGSFLYVGNNSAKSAAFTGPVAAVMLSYAYLSLRQLEAWAIDPWSFWYPPGVEQIIGFAMAPPPPPQQIFVAYRYIQNITQNQ
jgi:hypothetical protein